MLTCLWLSRAIPFPLSTGDRKYSAKLAEAFAATGVAITFVGLVGDSPPPAIDNVAWHAVPGRQRGRIASLLSTMPLVAARHSTARYQVELRRLLRSKAWDVIVIDYCGMAWTLADVRRLAPAPSALVFVTHNHEESLTRQQWQDTRNGFWQRLYLLQNYLKTRHIEHATCQACDLITAITETDAVLFRQKALETPVVTITPGYDGPRVPHRQITTRTSRTAVMFGSYRWSVKQTNLRLFLECADARMRQAGIEVRIVGDIPDDLRQTLERQYKSTRFTGFVQNPEPHLDARLAIVAEPISGGFKLKLLDYIFRRIPIVALETCVAGLSEPVRRNVLTVPDLAALPSCVEAVIDDVERLNDLQQGAFHAAEQAFDWAERGRALHEALRDTDRAARLGPRRTCASRRRSAAG